MSGTASILVIDVGSSSVRATTVSVDGAVSAPFTLPTPPSRNPSGTVEIDPEALYRATIAVAEGAIAASDAPPDAISIASQRATTVLFDRASGAAVGPGISWQDVRTTGQCLMLRSQGLRLQPSQSATKLSWLLSNDRVGGDRCFGTLETYLVHRLSGGAAHVTDATNAAVTGLVSEDASGWDQTTLDALDIAVDILPEIVDSTATVAPATALTGAPIIAGLVGDQQASLIGQGCLVAGSTKMTFGTGGMLDLCLGRGAQARDRGEHGTFPIVGWRDGAGVVFGVEAMALSAGSSVDWLVEGLGILRDAAASEEVAGAVRDAGGVSFVPAIGGLGTPLWDHGARGTITGISGGTTRHEIVRAVLDGIAHCARDLVDAVEADTGVSIDTLAVDGGMTRNGLFVQIVANTIGRPVRLSAMTEATTLGAAMLGGVAIGEWDDLEAAAGIIRDPLVVAPTGSVDRSRWLDARERSLRTVPALSMLTF